MTDWRAVADDLAIHLRPFATSYPTYDAIRRYEDALAADAASVDARSVAGREAMAVTDVFLEVERCLHHHRVDVAVGVPPLTGQVAYAACSASG
jgi:hypothetical protein